MQIANIIYLWVSVYIYATDPYPFATPLLMTIQLGTTAPL